MALWPFGGKKAPEPPTFVFTDDEAGKQAFFRLQCKYGDTKIEMGKGIVAIVLDASREFPKIPHAVKIEPDGTQLALIRVISEDGGFIVPATTPSSKGDRLVPGDFVAWVPHTYTDAPLPDKRACWVGFIRAKIRWKEWGTTGQPELICRYD
jgi:hypothetical protein